jgi:signal transduction histidine kinase
MKIAPRFQGIFKSRSWLLISYLFCSLSAGSIPFSPLVSSVELADPLQKFKSLQFRTAAAAQAEALKKGMKEMELTLRFSVPNTICEKGNLGIFFGYIYDQDHIELNGRLIGSTGDPQFSLRRMSLINRVYPLPDDILRCNDTNVMRIYVRRILGGWLGPDFTASAIGNLTELQEMSLAREAVGPLLQRDIGIFLLAIALFVLGLFWKYPESRKQISFTALTASAALSTLSLSGWFYRYSNNPVMLFKFHVVFVSVMLVHLIRFISLLRGSEFLQNLSYRASYLGSFAVFGTMAVLIGSPVTLLSIYLYVLLFLGAVFVFFYFSPLFKIEKIKWSVNKWIEAALFVILFSVVWDISRIWKVHKFENISPYGLGIGLAVIAFALASELVGVFQKAAQFAQIKSQNEKMEALTNLAAQVAHDIRSPLTALSMIAGEGIATGQKRMVKQAVQRINDIANDLLYRSGASGAEMNAGCAISSSDNISSVQSLAATVERILSEKRIQFRTRFQIPIEFSPSASAHFIFVKVSPVEFARALSNVVNNAVESVPERGKVIVSIEEFDPTLVDLVIKDNGSGIPPKILHRLGERAFTWGKKDGSGLGLFQAKSFVEASGGKLMVESEVGKGTSVRIRLPVAEPPEGTVTGLSLFSGTEIVICDDEASVHSVWEERFELEKEKKTISLTHFSSGEKFSVFHREHGFSDNTLYLIDYEFLGEFKTGLDLICASRISEKSILVTSRFEESEVRQRAAKLGVKILPKPLIPYLSILVQSSDLASVR